MTDYLPGTRVVVFDNRLYRDDKSTPIYHTMQSAIVLRWYGKIRCRAGGMILGPYESLIDVRFDHDGRESRAHFTDHVQVL